MASRQTQNIDPTVSVQIKFLPPLLRALTASEIHPDADRQCEVDDRDSRSHAAGHLRPYEEPIGRDAFEGR